MVDHLQRKKFNNLSPKDILKYINRELEYTKDLDIQLPDPHPNSWRAYGKARGETNQSFGEYYNQNRLCPDHRPLFIQLIGNFNETDKKIISITIECLKVFHNTSVNLQPTTLTMDQLKNQYLDYRRHLLNFTPQNDEEKMKLENDQKGYKDTLKSFQDSFPRQKNGQQYDGELVLRIMREILQPKLDEKNSNLLIAFTSDDLFTHDNNPVFGLGSLGSDVGIWSNARFGNPSESP